VLIDAFVIRGQLLPSLMELLGERISWAPAPLRRLQQWGADAPPAEAPPAVGGAE